MRLRGDRLGEGEIALIFCHGFMGWRRKARLVLFEESLARSFTVYAFDLRGHGESGGLSAFGAMEHLDVDAVVRLAREDGAVKVVTLGGSMGGIAVLRHAALLGGVDAVVAISTPAVWDGHDSDAVRRLARLTASSRVPTPAPMSLRTLEKAPSATRIRAVGAISAALATDTMAKGASADCGRAAGDAALM